MCGLLPGPYHLTVPNHSETVAFNFTLDLRDPRRKGEYSGPDYCPVYRLTVSRGNILGVT